MPKPEQENPGGPSEITSSGNRISRRVQELLLGAKENWALLVDRDLESPHLFLGITTKNIQNLIAEIQKLGFALGINQLKYSMLNRSVPTISILPLLEKAAVQDVGPEDVRPYRGVIKQLDLNLGCVDGVLGCLSFLVVPMVATIPLFMLLNHKIEKQVPEMMPKLLAAAQQHIRNEWGLVQQIGGLENPRQQFNSELAWLSRDVSVALHTVFSEFISGNGVNDIDYEVLAVEGLRKGATAFLGRRKQEQYNLPLLSIMLRRFGITDSQIMELLENPNLDIAIPEILSALGADAYIDIQGKRRSVVAILKERASEDIIRKPLVGMNPIPKKLAAVKELPTLISDIAAVLPRSGSDFVNRYRDQAQRLGVDLE